MAKESKKVPGALSGLIGEVVGVPLNGEKPFVENLLKETTRRLARRNWICE